MFNIKIGYFREFDKTGRPKVQLINLYVYVSRNIIFYT